MKALLLIVSLLTITSAQAALNPNSSWSKIQRSVNHRINTPSIAGGLFNLCLNDYDQFETVKAVKTCSKYKEIPATKEEPAETVCVKYSKKHLTVARETTKRECVDWVMPRNPELNGYCARYDVKRTTLPVTYNLSVERERSANMGYAHAFYKKYTIPTCK